MIFCSGGVLTWSGATTSTTHFGSLNHYSMSDNHAHRLRVRIIRVRVRVGVSAEGTIVQNMENLLEFDLKI